MSFTLKFCLLQRSFLTRLLQTTGLSLALMTASAAAVRAADSNSTDTEIGADGATGFGDGFGDIPAGPGQPATANAAASSATGNATATATAKGGNGGSSIGENDDSPGGDASASSTAITTGSGDALSSANATGGNVGPGGFGSIFAVGGSATATANASATGDGKAIATASATAGEGDTGQFNPIPIASATSTAETTQGGLAQARSANDSDLPVLQSSTFQSTAKTNFDGVSVQSHAMEILNDTSSNGAETDAIAQGGSSQTFAPPGDTFFGNAVFAAATALPDKAFATTLIGDASNVADALLGPRDEIIGTAIVNQFAFVDAASEVTFDFSFQGDLLLGVIDSPLLGDLGITINGGTEMDLNAPDDTVIDLGSFGPNIDLTITGVGIFAIGGVAAPVPEPSTWAMMLAGFAGLGFLGWRGSRNTASPAA